MDYSKLTDEELKNVAKDYGIDIRTLKNKKRHEIVDTIELERIKRQKRLELQASTEVASELKTELKETKPVKKGEVYEDKMIKASKKVFCIFHNQEEEDVDVALMKGNFCFHLYPEKVHCLPEWLITNLNKMARYPRIEKKKDPVTNMNENVITGHLNRFRFEILGDAPDNFLFGLVKDQKIVDKFVKPVAI